MGPYRRTRRRSGSKPDALSSRAGLGGRSVGGASRSSSTVAVRASTVTGDAADLDGLGDGGRPRPGTFHEPTVVVAGNNLVVAELDGAEDPNVGEAADDTLSSNGRAASPGPLVARSAHRAAKGRGLLAARRAGLQGLGGHAENVSRETWATEFLTSHVRVSRGTLT